MATREIDTYPGKTIKRLLWGISCTSVAFQASPGFFFPPFSFSCELAKVASVSSLMMGSELPRSTSWDMMRNEGGNECAVVGWTKF